MKCPINSMRTRRNRSVAIQALGFCLALLSLTAVFAHQDNAKATDKRIEFSCAPGKHSITVAPNLISVTWDLMDCVCWHSIADAKRIILNAITNKNFLTEFDKNKVKQSINIKFQDKNQLKYSGYCYKWETIKKLHIEHNK